MWRMARRRTVHSAPCHPPHGEGARGGLCRRHRKSLLFHRHRGFSARHGNQGRRHPESHQGGRHLHRRPSAGQRRDQVRGDQLHGHPAAGPESDGRHRHRHVPREQTAHRDLRSQQARQYPARGDGREGRIAGARRARLARVMNDPALPAKRRPVERGTLRSNAPSVALDTRVYNQAFLTSSLHSSGGIDMAQISMAALPALKDSYVQLKTRMDKAVEDFRKEMTSTRTGRASVHMLDGVIVDAYGSQMPLNQLANVSAPEPQLITVQPCFFSDTATIEKAIRSGDLGLNPMNDGKLVRVPVPALTEERRKEMVKHLNKVLEEHRTAVRNIRRDGNDAIKKAMKDKKITEDEERGAMEQLQKLTDDEIKKMEEMAKGKEKEVMSV